MNFKTKAHHMHAWLPLNLKLLTVRVAKSSTFVSTVVETRCLHLLECIPCTQTQCKPHTNSMQNRTQMEQKRNGMMPTVHTCVSWCIVYIGWLTHHSHCIIPHRCCTAMYVHVCNFTSQHKMVSYIYVYYACTFVSVFFCFYLLHCSTSIPLSLTVSPQRFHWCQ